MQLNYTFLGKNLSNPPSLGATMWKTPVIIVNFKLYRQSSGVNAPLLLEVMERVREERGVEIVAALNPMDLTALREKYRVPMILQHVDAVDFGAHTGRLTLTVAKERGAEGLLINHSERKLTIADIDFLLSQARKMNMVSVVCSNNPRVSGSLAFLSPDFIAMEPPELIGGNISVSKARPEAITETINAVKSVRNVPVLVGAGIKNRDDVKRAMELGACGILVASGVVKAKDPYGALNDLVEGMI